MSQLKNINDMKMQSQELGAFVDNKASNPVKIQNRLQDMEQYTNELAGQSSSNLLDPATIQFGAPQSRTPINIKSPFPALN
jgi:hypothetical protein